MIDDIRRPHVSMLAALILSALLGSIFGAGALAAESLRATSQDGLRLVVGDSGAWVESAKARERVTERSDVTWRGVERLRHGWIAVGSRIDRDSGGRERLVLIAKSGSGSGADLPEPGAAAAATRAWPVPLVAYGELRGLAWLEGERTTALRVRAAEFVDGAWGEPVDVSVSSTGTQTALTGTQLADGRTLLSWSAYDGSDDEILWSVGRGASWSAPAVLHDPNGVPDVIPSVTQVGDHAVAAWSRFDGNDYRLRLARWSGDRWIEIDWQGGRGSLFPGFECDGATCWLLYKTTVPAQWNVVQLSETTLERRAGSEDDSSVRFRHGAFDIPAGSALARRPGLDLSNATPALVWPAPSGEAEDTHATLRWVDR